MARNRRQILKSLAAGGLSLAASGSAFPFLMQRDKLPVAAVVTTFFRNSHADVLVGKILEGWRQKGGPGPDLQLVSLYTDQVHSKDLSRGLAKKHGFPIASTIDEALTLGSDELKVAGVISIGEHGDYPKSATQQKMYPRRRFFDEIAATMERCGQFVPVFNDKHLSWNWKDAKHMYDLSKRRQIPFLAGSSLPVAWRYPAVDLPMGSEVEDAVVVGYGGLESYGFHAIESLQSIIERRKGGEVGVAAVTAVQGDQIWQAEKAGKWDRKLLAAALATFEKSADDLKRRLKKNAAFYLIEYTDGFKATVAMLNGVCANVAVAARIKDREKPFAFWNRLEEEFPYGHFEHLLRAIEHTFHSGKAAYPVERTLLTTGILSRVMQSLHEDGRRLVTPELKVAYQPADWKFANQTAENYPS